MRLKPGPHQQQCQSNIVECYKSNDSFDKVERCLTGLNAASSRWSRRRPIRVTRYGHVTHPWWRCCCCCWTGQCTVKWKRLKRE